MSVFKVQVTAKKEISIQILASESLPDGSAINRIQKEIVLKPKAAELLAERIGEAVAAVRDADLGTKDERTIDDIVDDDLAEED